MNSDSSHENTSGTGKDALLPDGVSGWSWGAFLLNWVWAIFNKTWIGLLAAIPFAGLLMAIALGIKGREWTWRNKRWESVEQFNRVQRQWSLWGFVAVVGLAVLGITAAIVLPALSNRTEQTAPLHRSDQEWQQAFSDTVLNHMTGISNSPYIYYLPEESTPDFIAQYGKLARKAQSDAALGIQPGNLLAYASPASTRMADVVVSAYTKVERNSMFGVRVLFIGPASENDRVASAVLPTGADYVFIDISGLR